MLLEFSAILMSVPTSQLAVGTHITLVGLGTKSAERRPRGCRAGLRHGACISALYARTVVELGRVRVPCVFTLADGVPQVEGATGRYEEHGKTGSDTTDDA